MIPIVRVFVSSTWLDLQPERQAVEKALQRMRQTKLNGMEYFGSRDDTTRQVSVDEVDRSDVYVGIVGGRYGSGITEDEYRRASEKQLPRFIYFKDEQHVAADERDVEADKQTRLATWKDELRKAHALGTGPFTSPDDLAARVTADLSNWLLDQWGPQLYLNGVGALPYGYAPRIENFLSEYLGTTTNPVPFGGREKDLKTLDAWLDDATAPPYLLMAAPAGRGKSALLVRWTRQLLAWPNISLVFVPISIRFRTNLSGVTFATLAARLATLHGETIPNTPSTSTEVWRGLVTDYLRRPLPNGERLVVVLDGLDEAADWEAGPDLFPLTPPDHVRVVVSARYRAGDVETSDWLRRLGWERPGLATSYDLDKLTSEGVGLVLESMGFPLAQLGASVDIVAELYRLTEGDPLLVKLYVEDLWSHKERVASLKPQDLGTLKPGLEGYFNRWWDDQRKLWGKESPLKAQNVQTVLNLLACSLGPLTQDDVIHLTQHIKMNTWDLEEALRPLERFVIGDGKIHGYVLSHPRLGNYFEGRLSASEQQAWQQRFLDWGKDTVLALEQGTLAPTKAPAYIVQYYGAHLEQAHAPAETLLTLVCHGWSKAWEAFEGSYAGFLNDVERAWKAAEQENEEAIARGDVAPRIGDEIRCALVRSSFNSLSSNLPIELIVQLVKHQKWTISQGLTHSWLIPHLPERTKALVRLATELTVSDILRGQVLEELITSVRETKNDWDRTEMLETLASHRPEAILDAAQALSDHQRARVLAALAPHCPDRVLDTVQTIDSHEARVKVLVALVPHCPKAVLAAVHALNKPKDLVTVLTVLAPHCPDAVLDTVQKINDRAYRVEVLAALAPHRPEAVLNALQTFRPIEHGNLLIVLAPHYPDAVLAMQEKGSEWYWNRAEVLAALAPHRPEAVLTAVHALHDPKDRATVLAALIPLMSGQKREDLLTAALADAQTIEPRFRAEVIAALAPYCLLLVRTDLYLRWREMLNYFSRATRASLMRHLGALVPIIDELGKAQALKDTFHAVQDVTTCWP